MKIQTIRMIVTIFTAISLPFFQAVPAGFASPVAPLSQRAETGDLVPVQSATEAPTQPAPAQAVIPPNPLMNTGGLSPVEEKTELDATEIEVSSEEVGPSFTQALNGEQRDIAVAALDDASENANFDRIPGVSNDSDVWEGAYQARPATSTITVQADQQPSFPVQQAVYSQEVADPVYLFPRLLAPEGSVIFPSTLMQYDANNVLLRKIVMNEQGQIESMASYGWGLDQEPTAKVEVYPQGSTQLYSVIQYDTQGQPLQVTRYIYEGAEIPIPPLHAPEGSVVFPSTLKHYDANNVLLREIVMNAQGQIETISSYVWGRDQEIPAKVRVSPQGSTQPYSDIQYDAQGQVIQVTRYEQVLVPTPITATLPDPTGVSTLSGSKEAGTSIWYSLDNGVSYEQLVKAGTKLTWTGDITLPVGTRTVLVTARRATTISGVPTVFSSQPADLGPVTYTPPVVSVPAQITATLPNAVGVSTLSGTREAGTSIWYSLDNGVSYKQLVKAGTKLTWTGNITLPVGTHTVLVQARKTAIVSGVSTVLSSQAADLGPVTYTPQVVPGPTQITATLPNAVGVSTLSGTREAGTSIWYSLDNGVSYEQLVKAGTTLTWTGNITLPVGTHTVLVQARKTIVISKVSAELLSQPVDLGPVTYTYPFVPGPTQITATLPNAVGVSTLSGTREAGTSIWYSVDNGVTYKQLVKAGTKLAWTGDIILPAGTHTVLVQARKTIVVSKDSALVPSQPVDLGPVTYTPPVVSVPTHITATSPSAAGVLTLSGTREAGTSIWYSLDNGANYKRLVKAGTKLTWTGNITLPAGTHTVLVQARKTIVVSKVSAELLSQPVDLGPLIYNIPE